MHAGARKWAIEEFGEADLGDARRKWRVISMASELLRRPGPTVAATFRDEAARQGAYDFLESPAVTSDALEDACGRSCAARCAGQGFVFVPVDGTTISLRDPRHTREIGDVGGGVDGHGRGLKVISALALDEAGVAIGLA